MSAISPSEVAKHDSLVQIVASARALSTVANNVSALLVSPGLTPGDLFSQRGEIAKSMRLSTEAVLRLAAVVEMLSARLMLHENDTHPGVN